MELLSSFNDDLIPRSISQSSKNLTPNSLHSRNEVFARKEEQKEIGQLEHNKVRRLHQLYVSFMRRI